MHQNKEFHLLSTPRYLGSPTGWARMQISCTSVSPTYPKLKLERPLPCNLDTPYPCSRGYFTIMLVVSSIHLNSRHFPSGTNTICHDLKPHLLQTFESEDMHTYRYGERRRGRPLKTNSIQKHRYVFDDLPPKFILYAG